MRTMPSRFSRGDSNSLGGRYSRLLRKAKRIAATMDGKQRIVAFALKGGRVVSTGLNSYRKTHPRQAHFARLVGQPKRIYIHAELAAIVRAPVGVDALAVFRFDKSGNAVDACPCPVCNAAISGAGITNVVHT